MELKCLLFIYARLVNLHSLVPSQKLFSGILTAVFYHCAKQNDAAELEQSLPRNHCVATKNA